MSLRLWRDRKPNSGVLARTVPMGGSGFQAVVLLSRRLLSLEDCSAVAGSNLRSCGTIHRLGTGRRRSTRSFTVIGGNARWSRGFRQHGVLRGVKRMGIRLRQAYGATGSMGLM